MKILTKLLLLFLLIFSSNCDRKFLRIENCLANEKFVQIEQCEIIDGKCIVVYNVTQPIEKCLVRTINKLEMYKLLN